MADGAAAAAASSATLNSAYRKWDHFGEDEDTVETKAATRFDLGDGDFTPEERVLWDSATIQAVKRLEKREREVWQIVVRRLHLWAAEEADDGTCDEENPVACRPFALFVVNLYPQGRVVGQMICHPPQRHPSAEFIAAQLSKYMLSPNDDGEAQHRPGKVVCASKAVAAQLTRTLQAVGIECTVLCEAPDMIKFVKAYSGLLVKKGVADASSANAMPGLLTAEKVKPPTVAGLFADAADLYRRAPWNYFSERQILRIFRPDGSRFWIGVLGSGDSSTVGVAVFYRRWDAERRMLPKDVASVSHPLDLVCAKCNTKGVSLKRCTQCKSVWYCNATCQRDHWPEHRRVCKAVPVQKGDTYWSDQEVAMLFEDQTSVSFEDLDAIEEHGWAIPDEHHIPLPTLMTHGQPSRPSLHLLQDVWLGVRVILQILSWSPAQLEEFFAVQLTQVHTITVTDPRTGGSAGCAVWRDPIFSKEEEAEIDRRAAATSDA